MDAYVRPVEIRWADLDPNFHLRHSVYYDFGAYCRISFLEEKGLGPAFMAKNHFGPILFREECIFRKEIRLGDVISIDLQLLKARQDMGRWAFQHNFVKKDGVLAAILTVEGAWIDVLQRKLTIPPESARQVFENMPRAEQFEWIT
jgi:acyl-CoA thioester hydrolase